MYNLSELIYKSKGHTLVICANKEQAQALSRCYEAVEGLEHIRFIGAGQRDKMVSKLVDTVLVNKKSLEYMPADLLYKLRNSTIRELHTWS